MKQLILIPILLFGLLSGGILIGVNIAQPEEIQPTEIKEITFNQEYGFGINDHVKTNTLHAEDCETTGEFEGVIVSIYQPQPSICTIELEDGSKRTSSMYYLEKVN